MNARAVIGWGLVALCAWPWFPPPERPALGEAGPLTRWLGPIGSLAASAEWVRWNSAMRHGDTERAYLHAGRALALDPRSPVGWSTLGQHLVFDRSAAALERDPAQRGPWARAGLDVLREGEARSSDPAALALIAGDLAVFLSERAGGDLPWPGGAAALLDEAAASYARALAFGHPKAGERIAQLAVLRGE